MTTRSLPEQVTAHGRSLLHFDDVQVLHISFNLKCLLLVSTAFDQEDGNVAYDNRPFYTCELGVLAFE